MLAGQTRGQSHRNALQHSSQYEIYISKTLHTVVYAPHDGVTDGVPRLAEGVLGVIDRRDPASTAAVSAVVAAFADRVWVTDVGTP